MSIKQKIKKIFPSKLWGILHNARILPHTLHKKGENRNNLKKIHTNYKSIISRIKKKDEPINVLFMALEASVWKYDSLYKLMESDPQFNPLILVCPQVNRGYDFMIEKLSLCASFFKEKKYRYEVSYDAQTNEYIDAHTYKPDIIFYTNPYEGLIDNRYYIDKFRDSLTCYVNYAYSTVTLEYSNNLPFHQQVWRYFVECEDNKALIKRMSPINASNCVVVGYPMYDDFAHEMPHSNPWKDKKTTKKRIIWSPHHTISNQTQIIHFSTFELYYDAMVRFAKKFKNDIQIAFKPHPLLKEALYRLDGWGKERTDAYYTLWNNMENTIYIEGEYVDLFKSSDAIINDSGSFLMEYLYTQKPCLYLNNYDRRKDANKVAKKAFGCWYHATTEKEIENFIEYVVLKGNDLLKEERVNFYNNVLLPPNGCSVAENILKDIKYALKK